MIGDRRGTVRVMSNDNDNVQPWVPSGIEGVSAERQAEAAARLERIKTTATELWELILEAHDRQDWVALGYHSFKSYIELGCGLSRGQGYRLIDQGHVVRAIEEATRGVARATHGTPVSARQAATLKADLPAAADEIAAAVDGGVPVKDAVKDAVAKRKPPTVEKVEASDVEVILPPAKPGVTLTPAPAAEQLSFAWWVEDEQAAFRATMEAVATRFGVERMDKLYKTNRRALTPTLPANPGVCDHPKEKLGFVAGVAKCGICGALRGVKDGVWRVPA